jgi:hypothetical protein
MDSLSFRSQTYTGLDFTTVIIADSKCLKIQPSVRWELFTCCVFAEVRLYFMKDPRFRIIDPAYFYAVACLSVDEMRELQSQYRPRAEGLDHWKDGSDRLDSELQGGENSGRWWLVSVYEWESGVE